MEIISDIQKCTGCTACYSSCPKNAIIMKENMEGFLVPIINSEKCVECGICRNICPVNKQDKQKQIADPQCYAVYSLDEKIHQNSSSGGVFAVIAKYILNNGGAVCGAAFAENLEVRHILIEDTLDLYKLQGSKYVESRLYDSFIRIKEELDSGKIVLFSGTMCQVQGLLSFLKKPYDNLFTIDLICHGVPSPIVFKKYLSEQNIKNIIEIKFRDKKKGIDQVNVVLTGSDGQIEKHLYENDIYIKGFLGNLYLKPSCYQCEYKGAVRNSDITIGDFWGVKEFNPNTAHSLGTSAVIVHSKKGNRLLESVKNELKLETTTIEKIAHWNKCLLESSNIPDNRTKFYEDLNTKKLNELISELLPQERTIIRGQRVSKLHEYIMLKTKRFFTRVKN